MTARRYKRIQNVLAKRQPDLTILAEDVYKPHNLSAMLRTCDAVGIQSIHAINPTGGIPTFNETSGSANKWLNLNVYKSFKDAYASIESQKMQLIATTLSDSAVDYRDIDYTKPTCILFGNEKKGVSVEAAAKADHHIIIPMLGMVQSLNVSVATAVILFEAQRQRRDAGFYEKPRLDAQFIHKQSFRWLYPKEAEQFDQENKPYPELNEEGMIQNVRTLKES